MTLMLKDRAPGKSLARLRPAHSMLPKTAAPDATSGGGGVMDR